MNDVRSAETMGEGFAFFCWHRFNWAKEAGCTRSSNCRRWWSLGKHEAGWR